jgi:hypothetical protein
LVGFGCLLAWTAERRAVNEFLECTFCILLITIVPFFTHPSGFRKVPCCLFSLHLFLQTMCKTTVARQEWQVLSLEYWSSCLASSEYARGCPPPIVHGSKAASLASSVTLHHNRLLVSLFVVFLLRGHNTSSWPQNIATAMSSRL